MMANNPNMNRPKPNMKMAPPHMVKSDLVVHAYTVMPNVIAAVMNMAANTRSGEYLDATIVIR